MKNAVTVLIFGIVVHASLAIGQSEPGKRKLNIVKDPENVKIGSQVWTSENLNVEQFRNMDSIQEAKNIDEWKQALNEGKPAWCYYEFNEASGLVYGKFYNWYAVNDPRGLAPKGWHIPEYQEWESLFNTVGLNLAWDKMVDATGWMKGMSKTSNETGFSVLGGGLCGESSFGGIGMETAFWCASKDTSSIQNNSNLLTIHFGISWAPGIGKVFGEEKGGMYVRCVMD